METERGHNLQSIRIRQAKNSAPSLEYPNSTSIFFVEGMTSAGTEMTIDVSETYIDRNSNRPALSGRWRRPPPRFYVGAKRFVDIAAIACAAPVILPLVGMLALLVRLDGDKAFYRQQRLGKDGRAFTIWKLRSMVPDAEECLNRHLAADAVANLEWETTQKLKNDPRVTKLGRYLRKYSLDELPQLWNVLIGDMSLVGPRPMFADQRRLYPGTAYFELRPGLTGLWQVSDRNNCSFAERATYDATYVRIVSFRTDLRILSRTFSVVLNGTGV
jgi:exopolysaccharide production protein ExoY